MIFVEQIQLKHSSSQALRHLVRLQMTPHNLKRSIGRRIAQLGESSKRVRLSSEEEVEQYLTTPPMTLTEDDSKFDVLQWWQQHSCLFPGLSRVAKALFAISPTSSPQSEHSEQVETKHHSLETDSMKRLYQC